MKQKQELNTSCRATFKNGEIKDFASIEEAAQETGLTVAAIKIRCNKPGCGGKDKTTFEWLDEHTKRSYQAKKSRSKGASWEREVINKLKEIKLKDGLYTFASEKELTGEFLNEVNNYVINYIISYNNWCWLELE